jgi:phage tail tape-measure protein
MSDNMPVSADFPTMGHTWPADVINVSGSAAGRRMTKKGSGKREITDRKGPPRRPVLIRDGDGPKPVTVRRFWAANAAEASATSRNVRIMPRGGNQFTAGRGDGR